MNPMRGRPKYLVWAQPLAGLLLTLGFCRPAFSGEIHDAVYRGDLVKVTALLKERPELISEQDYAGRTPLHLAALWGRKEVAEFLLANKAEVNARDNQGATPLHLAAANDHGDVAGVLLDNKADINSRNDDGATPLFAAVVHDHIAVAEFLLDNKADVNARTNDGITPLHHAMEHSQTDMADLLRKYGGVE